MKQIEGGDGTLLMKRTSIPLAHETLYAEKCGKLNINKY